MVRISSQVRDWHRETRGPVWPYKGR